MPQAMCIALQYHTHRSTRNHAVNKPPKRRRPSPTFGLGLRIASHCVQHFATFGGHFFVAQPVAAAARPGVAAAAPDGRPVPAAAAVAALPGAAAEPPGAAVAPAVSLRRRTWWRRDADPTRRSARWICGCAAGFGAGRRLLRRCSGFGRRWRRHSVGFTRRFRNDRLFGREWLRIGAGAVPPAFGRPTAGRGAFVTGGLGALAARRTRSAAGDVVAGGFRGEFRPDARAGTGGRAAARGWAPLGARDR